MKKWLLGLLVIIALLVLVAPGIVGRQVEQNIEDILKVNAAPGVEIQTERFERGWFTSESTHRSRYADAEKAFDVKLPSLIVHTKLAHGPLPGGALPPRLASAVSTFQIDPGDGQPFDAPGTLNSNIGLGGESDGRLILEAGASNLDGARLEWQGVDMRYSSAGPGRVLVEGAIKPWQIKVDDATVSFSTINIKLDQVRSKYGFSVGTFDMEMGRMETGAVDAAPPMAIDSLALTGESSLDGDRINAHLTFGMNNMTVPIIGGLSLDILLTLEGADAEALTAIGDTAQAAQSSANPEAAMNGLYESIEDDFSVLFNRGFEIRLDKLNLSLPQGMVAASVGLSIPEIDADAPFDWSAVLLRMTGKIDMRIPGAVYQMAAMLDRQASGLVAMGILKPDGEDYVLNAEYAQGLLNVNGSPMPIPMPQ